MIRFLISQHVILGSLQISKGLLTFFQRPKPRLLKYLPEALIAKTISGWIQTWAYIKLPTTEAYETFFHFNSIIIYHYEDIRFKDLDSISPFEQVQVRMQVKIFEDFINVSSTRQSKNTTSPTTKKLNA